MPGEQRTSRAELPPHGPRAPTLSFRGCGRPADVYPASHAEHGRWRNPEETQRRAARGTPTRPCRGGWGEREPDRRAACGGTGGAGAVRRRPQLCSPGLRRGPEAWPWATRSSGGAGGCPLQHTLTAQTTSVQQTGDSALSGFSRFWTNFHGKRPPGDGRLCVWGGGSGAVTPSLPKESLREA